MPAPRASSFRLADQLLQLDRMGIGLVIGLMTRPWLAASRHLEAVLTAVSGAALGPDGFSEALVRGLLRQCQAYCIEMASVVPLAIEEAALQLVQAPRADLHDGRPQEPHQYIVDGQPVLLPARLAAASQGWAVYLIPTALAVSELERLGMSARFYPLDVGGWTPLLLTAIDYRATDFGAYHEFAIELWVTRQGLATDVPALFVLSMAVDSDWSARAAKAIWGFEKGVMRHMATEYHPGFTRFSVSASADPALSVAFPRLGRARSTQVPVQFFTVAPGTTNGDSTTYRTVFRRSAEGEGVQFGGRVALQRGNLARGNCICAGDPARCPCATVLEFCVPRRPAANGWAEHMSAEISVPQPC